MFRLYHNDYTESLLGRPCDFLFACYAWEVFHKSLNSTQSPRSRKLAVRKANGQMPVSIFSCRLSAQDMRLEEVETSIKEARELDTIHHNAQDAARLSAADQ